MLLDLYWLQTSFIVNYVDMDILQYFAVHARLFWFHEDGFKLDLHKITATVIRTTNLQH